MDQIWEMCEAGSVMVDMGQSNEPGEFLQGPLAKDPTPVSSPIDPDFSQPAFEKTSGHTPAGLTYLSEAVLQKRLMTIPKVG